MLNQNKNTKTDVKKSDTGYDSCCAQLCDAASVPIGPPV